ncbi:hypothetical protein BGZ60DRAFT_2315 [Tricladium varicosporioides]|nr:hypothetical protein BGZ60DRAFT_2315 [Hymenoscyphus varicosporioides]
MARTSGEALFIPGSIFGTMKSFASFKHILDGAQYLVVAIRATWTTWDWIVNFNSEPAECTELGNRFKCHKGFLLAARSMKASIENNITEYISTLGRPTNVIFAGHSAGAAIAQLFSLIGLDCAVDLGQSKYRSNKLQTFGCPSAIFPTMPSQPSCLFLNIKNEGDPATLARPYYIESLLHTYVLNLRINSVWKAPYPFYYSSGDQIILRDMAEEMQKIQPHSGWTRMR